MAALDVLDKYQRGQATDSQAANAPEEFQLDPEALKQWCRPSKHEVEARYQAAMAHMGELVQAQIPTIQQFAERYPELRREVLTVMVPPKLWFGDGLAMVNAAGQDQQQQQEQSNERNRARNRRKREAAKKKKEAQASAAVPVVEDDGDDGPGYDRHPPSADGEGDGDGEGEGEHPSSSPVGEADDPDMPELVPVTSDEDEDDEKRED